MSNIFLNDRLKSKHILYVIFVEKSSDKESLLIYVKKIQT